MAGLIPQGATPVTNQPTAAAGAPAHAPPAQVPVNYPNADPYVHQVHPTAAPAPAYSVPAVVAPVMGPPAVVAPRREVGPGDSYGRAMNALRSGKADDYDGLGDPYKAI